MIARDLAAEVAVWLVEHGEGSAYQIAQAIRARAVDVKDTLLDDERFSGPHDAADPADPRLYYRLVAVPATRPGRAGKATDADRLLAVLSDGREHSHRSLYRLHMVVHSRISDLRARGYKIECRRDGSDYLYRIVSAPLSRAENSPAPVAAPSTGEGFVPELEAVPAARAGGAGRVGSSARENGSPLAAADPSSGADPSRVSVGAPAPDAARFPGGPSAAASGEQLRMVVA